MSRIGNKAIEIPNGVKINIASNNIVVEGPKGKLEYAFIPTMKVYINEENMVVVERPSDEKQDKMYHGLTRALIANMVTGVNEGFQKRLLIEGVGYNAKAQGKQLVLNLGYSHPINFDIPEGIAIETPTQTEIIIKGIDRQQVGQVAANIREFRGPEPYKGKGIRYSDEIILRKAGKAGAKK